jgi:hypothetical protein
MTVLRHTGGNIGGINPVQYVFKEDVESFSFSQDSLYAEIVLFNHASWNYLYGTPDTIQLEGKEEETPAGTKYTYQLKMLIPKDRIDVERILFQLNNRHLIINVIDKNGVSRCFGNLQSPMKKQGKLMKPTAVEGFHGWEVVFAGEFSEPAAYFLVIPNSVLPPPDPLE